jgi:LruC domain-containing protein
MDVPSSKVSSVRNTESFSSDQISLAANGTESGLTQASIIVFSDAFDVLPHPGGGLGINTDPDKEHVEAVRVTVEIDFTEGLTMQDIGNAPNNPFIFRTKDRTHEIHLPGYRPTSKADISKFGTGSDVTNFDNEYFYKTGKGLPWGMNLPVTFVYPRELVSIIKGHLKFNQWATSGGYSFMDWYDDVEGYRDNSKLYTR